jgi:hypothetical protein
MNTLKAILLALIGFSMGNFATQWISSRAAEGDDPTSWDEEWNDYVCHGGAHTIDDLIATYSEEDQQRLETFVDAWLIDNGLTMDEVEADWDLYRDLMHDTMDFIIEQDLEPEPSWPYRHGGHMGW